MSNANGKVTIGFSHPLVAKHSVVDGVCTFTDTRVLARGVSVSVEPNTSDDNTYYADDSLAETAGATFTGGTLTLTVDGLFMESERYLYGLPASAEDGWTSFGDNATAPYVSVGYIVKSQSNGNQLWTPQIILKNKFNPVNTSAETQGEDIDWQSQELTANIQRSEDSNHNWKYIGADFTSEAEAFNALKTKMAYVEPTA